MKVDTTTAVAIKGKMSKEEMLNHLSNNATKEANSMV